MTTGVLHESMSMIQEQQKHLEIFLNNNNISHQTAYKYRTADLQQYICYTSKQALKANEIET